MLNRFCIGILINAVCFSTLSYGEIFEECGQREGLYISSNLGCSYYIFCYGEDSFMEQCDEDTPYFSEIDQTCDTEASVCNDGTGEGASSAADNSSKEIEEQSSTTEVAIPSTESTLITTQMSITSTTIISAAPTSTTTTMASATSPSLSPATASTAVSHLATQCPMLDDPKQIVFLADTKSCVNYFMCYHGEPVAMFCSNKLHFDQKSQKCDYPENVKCQLESSSSPQDKCQPHTFDVFSHPTNCNYYYLCRYGFLMVMQCPFNMGWDYEKRACVRRNNAKCYDVSVKSYKLIK